MRDSSANHPVQVEFPNRLTGARDAAIFVWNYNSILPSPAIKMVRYNTVIVIISRGGTA
jgi:hypothetical protein